MPGQMRFVLDGETRVVCDADPTRTVLAFLREDLGRTGTKEGCAEGDCGACTVVIRELGDDGPRLRAINACIAFLPTLDGKELITVESLQRNGKLHPVQQAMVDCHGSQCGFCTPGFVMSLYALYATTKSATSTEVADTLAGNLCRCTGYRPIFEAAQAMYRLPECSALAHEADERALLALCREDALTIENEQHRYFAPLTLEELAGVRAEHPSAHILAGGTDLALWVTKGLRDLAVIIYVGCVAELKRIVVGGGYLELGAAVTWSDAIEPLTTYFPQMDEMLRRFASPPIRNAATIGGNIVNGSPIGDSMPALLALDARLLLRHGSRTREVRLDAFYTGYQRTVLEAGEFLECVRIPLLAADQHFRVYKLSKRFDQDISAVCGAYRVTLREGCASDVRVAYGGMAAVPARASRCEESLTGRTWDDAALSSAMSALSHDFMPISDMRASAEYRALSARTLLYRFFVETCGEIVGEGSDDSAMTCVRSFGRGA